MKKKESDFALKESRGLMGSGSADPIYWALEGGRKAGVFPRVKSDG